MSTQHQTPHEELCELARAIRDWQTAKTITDTRLCADFDIGSTKTFIAFAAGTTAGYDTDRWLPKYRAAWNLIQTQSDSGDAATVFDDLTPAIRLRAAFSDAMRENGNDRLIIVEGGPGEGKTTAVAALHSRYGSRIVLCEASETWRESINAMLSDILRALGVNQPPVSGGLRLEKIIEILNARRQCLVIDEAHHMGPRGLNMVKTIINRTPGEIIMMGLPVLLKRLEMDAYQEARQLTLNRLCERIRLHGVEPSDAAKLLQRVSGVSAEVAQSASIPLAAMASTRGALKFCSKVSRRVARDGATDADAILKIASKVAANH
jgi:DNA transposition AAA+ family ATPase